MRAKDEQACTAAAQDNILYRHLDSGQIGTWVFRSQQATQTITITQAFLKKLGYENCADDCRLCLSLAVHADDQTELWQYFYSKTLPIETNVAFSFRIYDTRTCEWQWISATGMRYALPDGGWGSDGIVTPVQQFAQHTQESTLSGQIKTTFQPTRRTITQLTDSCVASVEALNSLPQGQTKTIAETIRNNFNACLDRVWRFKAVMDNIPLVLTVANAKDELFYANPAALKFYGAELEQDLLGKNKNIWSSAYTEDSNLPCLEDQNVRQLLLSHNETGKIFRGHTATLYGETGDFLGSTQILEDVTEAYENEERVQIMHNANPFASTFWDQNYNNIGCNDAVCLLLGTDKKQEYLDNFSAFSPEFQPNGERSAEASRKHIEQAFATGHTIIDWTHKKIDGTLLPTEVTLVRVERKQGAIVVGYIRDLSQLKLAETSLERERKLLQLVMDSSPVCFFVVVDGIIRYATPYTTLFFGVNQGSSITPIYTKPGTHERIYEELLRTGSFTDQVITTAADASLRHMQVNAFVADYYGETCTMAWFNDVSELHEQEIMLRHARDVAEKNTEAKGTFLANMSHEIRTPMNAILGMIHLVLGTELSNYQCDYLNKAVFATKTLLRIINDILDFSKIEADKMTMEETPFSIAEVVYGVESILRNEAASRNLDLLVHFDPKVPLGLIGDPLRLNQIITNLTSNAIKFTHAGSVSIHVDMVESDATQATLKISVKDTGIGLSPEQITTLFAPFSQVDFSVTRKYGGTGLGLAISKRLVEMMEGTILCESVLNEGSTFFFTAKFGISDASLTSTAQDAGIQEELDAVRKQLADGVLQGKHILVAEDNEMNSMIIKEVLEKEGIIVELAENGAEAVEKVEQNEYDLVFMDIQMPVMDGLTATEKIREFNQNIPIIAMTAHAMRGDKERSLTAGMNGHITKPLEVQLVLEQLVRWLYPSENALAFADATDPAEGAQDTAYTAQQEDSLPDFPEHIAGLDISVGLHHTKGDKRMYRAFLCELADKIPASFDAIATSVMVGQNESLLLQLHALRSEVLRAGGEESGRLMQEMIVAVRRVTYQPLFAMLDKLEVLLIQLERAIHMAFPEE